jgi:hypothetical protein
VLFEKTNEVPQINSKFREMQEVEIEILLLEAGSGKS